MSAIFMATATVKLGQTTTDKDGNIVKQIAPSCEFDPAGGSVIVGKLKITDDAMEPDGPAEVFGDWDAAGYLAEALEALRPSRRHNLPDFEKIVKSMVRERAGEDCPFMDHCGSVFCRDCVISRWMEEAQE